MKGRNEQQASHNTLFDEQTIDLYDNYKHLCLDNGIQSNKMSVNLCVRDACCSFLPNLYRFTTVLCYTLDSFSFRFLRLSRMEMRLASQPMEGPAVSAVTMVMAPTFPPSKVPINIKLKSNIIFAFLKSI